MHAIYGSITFLSGHDFFLKLRTNTKLTPTQDNYLNTSIYMPLAELRQKSKSDALPPSYQQVLSGHDLLNFLISYYLAPMSNFVECSGSKKLLQDVT